MPRRILVCLDGSKDSHKAFDLAVKMMDRDLDTLFLVCGVAKQQVIAFEQGPLPSLVVSDAPAYAAIDAENVAAAVRVLKGYSDYYRSYVKNLNADVLSDPSDLREGVLTYIAEHSIDVVYVGTRGMGTVKRAVLGSFSEYMVSHCPCSVVVAHDSVDHPVGQGPTMVCLDGSEQSSVALRTAISSMDKEHDVLHLFVALQELSTVSPADLLPFPVDMGNTQYEDDTVHNYNGELRILGERLVTEARAVCEQAGVKHVVTHIAVTSGDARDAATQYIDDNKIVLVVVGTRGLGAVQRFVLGSFSTHMLRHANAHVMVAKQPAATN